MQTKRNFTRGLIAALPPAFGWAGGADGAAPAKGTGAGGAGIENVIAAFCVPVGAIEMAAAGAEGDILLLVQFFRHGPHPLLFSSVGLPAMPYVSVPPILRFRPLDGLGYQIVSAAVGTGGVPVGAFDAAFKISDVSAIHYAHPHRIDFTQPGQGRALTKRTHPSRS